ncbi:Peroxidase C1B [Glycine soja]|uniref:Peroxidase n=1 Tax=Glycine soja TaxID=3848 RepID=A0A445GT03_GLYSO|nr:Peroxidase C1B [Glycine soja]
MKSFHLTVTALCCVVVVLGVLPLSLDAQLDPSFYRDTCPRVHSIVREVVRNVSKKDPRMLASLIRLHFHDCFVQGCDASVLLNNTATIESEQQALPNNNSLRGLDVVNDIKTAVEKACPGVVSCADILTLASEISSVLGGGPDWKVPLGRRDSLTANRNLANQNLPAPFFNLSRLKSAFAVQGLDTTDLVALSVELANLIQLLTQLTYNNCAKYAPMVDLTTLSILTLSLLIKLTGSTSPIFRLRRACFRVIKSCSRHLVPIPSPLSTGSAVTRKFSLTPLRLQ